MRKEDNSLPFSAKTCQLYLLCQKEIVVPFNCFNCLELFVLSELVFVDIFSTMHLL